MSWPLDTNLPLLAFIFLSANAPSFTSQQGSWVVLLYHSSPPTDRHRNIVPRPPTDNGQPTHDHHAFRRRRQG